MHTEEVTSKQLNDRQRWVMAELNAGRRPGGKALAEKYGVDYRTAMRDFTVLRQLGLVEFVGKAATGYYRLIER